jgi:elongation factor P--(R)-beta-lysine ligase
MANDEVTNREWQAVKLLRERARVLAQVRRFFDARGFLEVQTPSMVPSPGLEPHLDAFEVATGDGGSPRWLVTSPEYQMKRLLADGWERIYQIGSAFRRGERGELHNPEFTMLEWYRANAGIGDVMADTEQLAAAVTGGSVRIDERVIDLRPPLDRWTVDQAFARFAGWTQEQTLQAAETDEETLFRVFVDKVEPGLGCMDRGIFLVDFPFAQASLARAKPGDPRFAERFELYVAGIELCNGFGELVDPVEQRRRLTRDAIIRRARGLQVYPVDEKFIEALSRVPPSGGNALGLDRLVALACGTRHIADVMAFAGDEL